MTVWPSTSMILLAVSPCASRCTASAASLLGASTKQNTHSRVAVVPVAQVVDAVLRLHCDVQGVGAGELLGRDGHVVVAVHVRRHRDPLLLTPLRGGKGTCARLARHPGAPTAPALAPAGSGAWSGRTETHRDHASSGGAPAPGPPASGATGDSLVSPGFRTALVVRLLR